VSLKFCDFQDKRCFLGAAQFMISDTTTFTTEERAQRIRDTTPKILKKCFEAQGHLCDLCGQEISDVSEAELDHSTPVVWFARSPLSDEEAVRQANDPQNLRAAHASCNQSKKQRTRKEWFERNPDKCPGNVKSLEVLEKLGAEQSPENDAEKQFTRAQLLPPIVPRDWESGYKMHLTSGIVRQWVRPKGLPPPHFYKVGPKDIQAVTGESV
jgi:hypothetical protein